MATKVRCAFVSLVLVLGCALCAYAQLRPEVTAKPKPKRPPATKVAPKPAEKPAAKPVAPQKAAEPEPAQVIIETSPNAEVYLDDQFVGRASSQGRLVIADATPGAHTIRVSLAGKQDYEELVSVVAGHAARVSALPSGPAEAPSAPAPHPVGITIPAGTVVTVRMIDSIDSSRNRAGEEFAASVDAPIVVDGRVVIRRGADARVRLVEARNAGRMTGQSELQVELVGLAVGPIIQAAEATAHDLDSMSGGRPRSVGGGSALGALIGAIAGKGKGASVGAGVGAPAGPGPQAATRGQYVKIPSGTKLDFTLKASITVAD